MEFKITKRDVQREHNIRELTSTPINGTKIFTLDKFISGEEKFRELSESLQKVNCDIQVIEISKIVFNEQKAEYIARGLEGNDSVLELIITQSKIHSRDMQIICEAISRHEAIQSIELNGVNLTSDISWFFTPMLQQNVSLRRIALSNCGFGDKCVEAVYRGLMNSVSLQTIEFENTLFEEKGLVLLVKAMSTQFYFKKLKLGGVQLNEKMSNTLADFFKDERCMISDVSLHEMQTSEESMSILIESLNHLRDLQRLSLSKNALTKSLCQQVGDLCNDHPVMQLLCLSYCQLDRENLAVLCSYIKDSQLRYLDLSWNTFAQSTKLEDVADYSDSIRQILFNNHFLQKVLLGHNEFAHEGTINLVKTLCEKQKMLKEMQQSLRKDHMPGVPSFSLSMAQIQYLDISDTQISTDAFKFIIQKVSSDMLNLHVLECRKNNLDGSQLHDDCFLLLQSNHCALKSINLKNNNLDNECASQLLQVCTQRIPFSEVNLEGNQRIHYEQIEAIQTHCRMNFLIQKFIEPFLPTKRDRCHWPQSKKASYFEKYDTSKLLLYNEFFYRMDFAIKFLKINKDTCHTLVLRDIQTNKNFGDLIHCFEFEHSSIGIQSFSLIDVKIDTSFMCQLIRFLKNARQLQHLCLKHIKQFNMCVQDLYISLKNHPQMKKLEIADNTLSDFQFLVKLLKDNSTIEYIDVRKNYLNADIVDSIEKGLHNNLRLQTLLICDSDSMQFGAQVIAKINQQMEINQIIAKRMIPAICEYKHVSKLGTKSKFKMINLRGVTLSERDSDAITKLCQNDKEIRALDLSKTDLSDSQLKDIVDMCFEKKGSIEILKLNENNRIEDQQAKQLARCLHVKDPVLRVLELKETNLKAEGFYELMKALPTNTVLESIKCKMCRIQVTDADQIREIKQFIAQNHSLMEMEIAGNIFSDDLELFVAAEMEKNRKICEVISPKLHLKSKRQNVPFEMAENLPQGFFSDTEIKEFSSKSKSQIIPKRSSSPIKVRTGRQVFDDAFGFPKKAGSEQDKSNKDKFSNRDSQGSAPKASITQRTFNLFSKMKATGSFQPASKPLDNQEKEEMLKSAVNLNKPEEYLEVRKRTQSYDQEEKLQKPVSSLELKFDESSLPRPEERVIRTLDGTKKAAGFLNYSFNDSTYKTLYHVNLRDCNLTNLEFLIKFVSVHNNIELIDICGNDLNEEQLTQLLHLLKSDIIIQFIHYDTKSTGKIHRRIERELERNRVIQAIINDRTMHDEVKGSLNLANKGFKKINFLRKYLQHYPETKQIDLSNNKIGNEGCAKIAQYIQTYHSLRKLSLKNNGIGPDGLQIFCSSMCHEFGSKLSELNIKKNPIPDKSLKMLLAMLLKNMSILDIKYSLTLPANQALWHRYKQIEDQPAQVIRKQLLVDHEPEVPLWQKIVFPIWLWKSLMHDKHAAFAFKYDTVLLKAVENEIMENVGTILYINVLMYYFIMFFCPFFFVQECGYGLHSNAHTLYLFYAITNVAIESIIVFWIQSRIQNKAILKFNKWHFIELVFGTVGKLDTYLDMCILSLFLQCREWHFVGPIAFFILAALVYPVFRLSTLYKVDKTLSHTLPHMERNCQVCFIRENMLLATILDSFCIDNNENILNKPVHYGKLMGALTFFLQDLPQFLIHIIFLFTASGVPHGDFTVILSLVCSSFAICISFFNFQMQGLNEFNPIMLQVELRSRLERVLLAEENAKKKLKGGSPGLKRRKTMAETSKKGGFFGFLNPSAKAKEALSLGQMHRNTSYQPKKQVVRRGSVDSVNVNLIKTGPLGLPPLKQANSTAAKLDQDSVPPEPLPPVKVSISEEASNPRRSIINGTSSSHVKMLENAIAKKIVRFTEPNGEIHRTHSGALSPDHKETIVAQPDQTQLETEQGHQPTVMPSSAFQLSASSSNLINMIPMKKIKSPDHAFKRPEFDSFDSIDNQ